MQAHTHTRAAYTEHVLYAMRHMVDNYGDHRGNCQRFSYNDQVTTNAPIKDYTFMQKENFKPAATVCLRSPLFAS